MRKIRPAEVARTCVRYLGTRELNPAAREMLAWLTFRPEYVPHLLDPELLSSEEARRAAVTLREADPRFFARILAFLETHTENAELAKQAIELLEELKDFGILLPWLRALTQHTDRTIRSKAVKVICTVMPNQDMIARQLESADARVRANAIEALWHVQNSEAISILQHALSDAHHRVVANALLGLFYHRDECWLDGMTRLASHPSAMSRAAAAWALGETRDSRVIGQLQTLAKDPAPQVRKRAQRILSEFVTASACDLPNCPTEG
ncbi:MAG: hypothetical protein JOY54_08495 [Acidobacteriaceae bacterium]|nr:hypothetical protein [Acidobacteriaceae bacterium]